MASYRPYPPPPPFVPPPSQNPLPPPPLRPPSHGNQYSQNWASGSSFPPNYNQMPANSNFQHAGYGSSNHQYGSSRNQLHPPAGPLPQQPLPPQSQQPPQQFAYPPPPPPPDSSYPLPPPLPSLAAGQNVVNVQLQSQPGSVYYPTSQYSQYSQQPLQPPRPQPQPPFPPPPASPPSSAAPPPPPLPSSPLRPPQSKESGLEKGRQERDRRLSQEGHAQVASKQQKPSAAPHSVRGAKLPSGRVETEEERRLRKKKEMEKKRQEDRHKQQLKESQNAVLRKTQMLASAEKGHGSIAGSYMGERRATPLLSSERFENRLKKPTTFLCRMKFRNELPDPSAQMKLMTIKRDKDRFTRYTITSLEKMHKPKLYVEPDLGIPLDLLDLNVYTPPKEKVPLAPEDEDLLHDDVPVTPLKKDGIRRKERPSDQGVSWLVKTQYISPISNDATRQSLSEKQAKELRETRDRNILENLNNRERKLQNIMSSFEACKHRPVHPRNKSLQPVEVFPLLPSLDRCDDQFVLVNFDAEPTEDSEMFSNIDRSVHEAYKSKAIMKSFTATGSDPDQPERFLGYMVPSQDEVAKDICDEDEDVYFSWVREYSWDVKGEDLDDIPNYVFASDETAVRFLPLPTKLALRKRRAQEAKLDDDAEQFAPPSKVTVRKRDTTAVIEKKDPMIHQFSRASASSSRREISDDEDEMERLNEGGEDMGQYSEAEDYVSD